MVENINYDTEITTEFNKNAITVSEYAYCEDKNTRQYMEDKHFIKDHIFYNDQNLNSKQIGLFCVLDGHGGQDIVKHCTESIPILFKQSYKNNPIKDALQLFDEIFQQMDINLRKDKKDLAEVQGSCCCIAMISENICNVVNLGDTRAVLYQNGSVKRVSVDHKASNQDEVLRVQKAGGTIFRGRVSGNLAVTRALGDLNLKEEGVITTPDIFTFEFQRNNNQFLIIASDGLWDALDDQAAVDLIKDDLNNNQKSVYECSLILKNYAVQNISRDNVSVLLIKF